MASGTWGDPNVYTKAETDTAIAQSAAMVTPIILPASDSTYTDELLYSDLRTNAEIKPLRFCWFKKQFVGGMRYGFCFLYDSLKTYGIIVVFHYLSPPRCLRVNESTPTVASWATL